MGLSISIHAKQGGAEPTAVLGRELEAIDLVKLSLPGARATAEPASVQIRQYHHGIARMLAQGRRPTEISKILGTSLSRISTLQTIPAFQELLAYYKSLEGTAYEESRRDFHEKLSSLGFDSLELLHEDIVENSGKYLAKPDLLLKISEVCADRTGFGKTQTVNSNVNYSLSVEDLARVRSTARSEDEASDGETRRRLAERAEHLLRLANSSAGLDTEAEETDGLEGGGPPLREEGPSGTQEEVPEPGGSSVVDLPRRADGSFG